MAPALVLYRATIGDTPDVTEYWFLQAPNTYGGALDNICGVKIAAQSEQDNPRLTVSQLLKSGRLVRVAITYSSGTGRKTAKLLVVRQKLTTALDQLIGKSYRGGTILTARAPVKAKYK